ncbi:transmembrane ascorbate ferrireductase 4 [Hirschfeldia incana]|nr:transmembrane ascorbate ferrireductase 4 [Hirschfeldia incana]
MEERMRKGNDSLVLFARLLGLVIAVVVVYWFLLLNSTFAPRKGFTYTTIHALLMVIGFILVSGEAILIHRWLPGSRKTKKAVHLFLQGVALVSAVIGMWTKFHYESGVFSNFYSLHSWMGLLSVSLFAAQWVSGFLSFWHRGGEVGETRSTFLPWHVFLGLYIYGLAIATAETGLLVKLTHLQTKRNLPRRCAEAVILNGVGLGLVLLCGIVVASAVLPKYQKSHSSNEKLVYSSQDRPKCLAS